MQQLIDFATNNIILVAAFFIILFLLLRTYISPSGAKNVTAMEAVRLMNHDNALVLDVRTQEEYQKSHIANSVSIPLGLLSSRIAEIQSRKSDPVILVCQSGNRSMQAARTLKNSAFDKLHNLSGGMLSWEQANLPTESGLKSKSGKDKNAQKKTPNISRSKESSEVVEPAATHQDSPDEKEKIIVYTTSYCPYSGKVTRLLNKKGVNFQQVNVDNSPDIKKTIHDRSQQTTFPQVFIGESHIGNCDELHQLDRNGQLDEILGLKRA
ncbi:rhodanese-like domain-containing protein [Kaarinaea lacus]